jgi:plastocyanin
LIKIEKIEVIIIKKKIIGIFICMLMTISAVSVTAKSNGTFNPTPLLQLTPDVNITIQDYFFNPDNITIAVNTIVTWTNLGPSPHSSVSDDGVWNSGLLGVGKTFSFNFTTAGTYKYHCVPHLWMHGVIIVIGGGNLPPNKPTIDGPTSGKTGTVLNYTAVTSDPEGDNIQYFFDWGDGTNTGWTPSVTSGTISHQSHTWSAKGSYLISVKARDTSLDESPVATLSVKMPVDISYPMNPFQMVFFWLINKLAHIFPQFEDFIHI